MVFGQVSRDGMALSDVEGTGVDGLRFPGALGLLKRLARLSVKVYRSKLYGFENDLRTGMAGLDFACYPNPEVPTI